MAASGGSSSSWNMAVATNVWAALVVRELSPADYPVDNQYINKEG